MAKQKTSLELELQRAREDSEDLQRYIEEFSEFLPLPVSTINPSDIIIGINQAFQILTGYSEVEIVGEPFAEIFLEKKEIENILNKIQKEGGLKVKELTLISKQKKKIPVTIFIKSIKNKEGNFTGCFVSFTDITEIKKFHQGLEEKVKERAKELSARTEELEKSKKSLLNILEDVKEAQEIAEEEKNKTLAIINNFTDGLLVFDRENKILLINPQAENFFKIKSNEIEGKSILELSKNSELKSLTDLLRREIKSIFRKELPIKENLILEVSVVPIIIGKEKLGMLVILHDISREKMIERMKTEFVSLSAHQLRTPISAIKWTLRMLLDGDLGEITEEQRGFIEKTYQSNERMINLINDLLDATRIEEGKYLYKPTLADFENVVHFVINSYQEEIARKKIFLDFEKPKTKLPKITMDVEKIRLAIQNLLDNAVKYTPPRGRITILLEIVKFYDRDEKEIAFSVRDTGVGIPKDQQARVFIKFFRGANATRMNTEGTGLGLFISKNIIEAHGGKIWFESEEGRGTTFYFTLPVKEEVDEF